MANLIHLPLELSALGVAMQFIHLVAELVLRPRFNVEVRVKCQFGINPCPPELQLLG